MTVYADFSMDCPNCGPSTVHFVDGEMVPHGCEYTPPSVLIDCADGPNNGRSDDA